MKVRLRNPERTVEIEGPMKVSGVLARLEVNPESVIVIRGNELVTGDLLIADADEIELRPVISGGSDPGPR